MLKKKPKTSVDMKKPIKPEKKLSGPSFSLEQRTIIDLMLIEKLFNTRPVKNDSHLPLKDERYLNNKEIYYLNQRRVSLGFRIYENSKELINMVEEKMKLELLMKEQAAKVEILNKELYEYNFSIDKHHNNIKECKNNLSLCQSESEKEDHLLKNLIQEQETLQKLKIEIDKEEKSTLLSIMSDNDDELSKKRKEMEELESHIDSINSEEIEKLENIKKSNTNEINSIEKNISSFESIISHAKQNIIEYRLELETETMTEISTEVGAIDFNEEIQMISEYDFQINVLKTIKDKFLKYR